MGTALRSHHECSLCGSSDAATTYRNEETNQVYIKCFSCGEVQNLDTSEYDGLDPDLRDRVTPFTPQLEEKVFRGDAPSWRGISEETMAFYGVKFDDVKNSFSFPFFDVSDVNKLTGLKLRNKDEKTFAILHEDSWSKSGLFGSHRFPKGRSKCITITEGEIDALSAWEMLGRRNENPVVSTRNSTSPLSTKELEYLKSFEDVIICFDMDEAGQNAAKKLATALGPSAHILEFPQGFKDANEFLNKGGKLDKIKKDFTSYWWAAKRKVELPEDILSWNETWEDFEASFISGEDLVKWPFQGLNEKLYGIRPGQLITLTGGSGMGKSAVAKEVLYNYWKTTDKKVGAIFIEEPVGYTVKDLISRDIGVNLRIPKPKEEAVDPKEYKAQWDLLNDGRLIFWKHFGSADYNVVLDRIRFMHYFGCEFIVLDHLSIVISGQEVGDERKTIDLFATKLASLVTELNITVLALCHVSKSKSDKSWESGKELSLNDIRGSAAIGQLSFVVMSLERDAQNINKEKANTAIVRVLKDRNLGQTGVACQIKWDNDKFKFDEVLNDNFDIIEEENVEKHFEVVESFA